MKRKLGFVGLVAMFVVAGLLFVPTINAQWHCDDCTGGGGCWTLQVINTGEPPHTGDFEIYPLYNDSDCNEITIDYYVHFDVQQERLWGGFQSDDFVVLNLEFDTDVIKFASAVAGSGFTIDSCGHQASGMHCRVEADDEQDISTARHFLSVTYTDEGDGCTILMNDYPGYGPYEDNVVVIPNSRMVEQIRTKEGAPCVEP